MQAQFIETIRSGRPSQSIGAYTIGKGIFQIQTGLNYYGAELNTSGDRTTGYLTNTGLRFGLTETFEVGAFVEYTAQKFTSSNISAIQNGLSNVIIGIRHQIAEGKGLRPSIGFQFRLRLPWASEYFNTKNVAPSFVFVTSQQLSESITLITNLGGSWNGNDSTPTGTYTINLSKAITGTFGAFIENYGNVTNGVFQTRMDTGIAWLLNNNLQLDLYGGLSKNNGLNDYFVSTGFSWRTHRPKALTNTH